MVSKTPRRGSGVRLTLTPGYLDAMPFASQTGVAAAAGEQRLLVRRLDFSPDPERAFVHVYGASPNAFWLDSSAEGERGRFSFMGDSEGPLGAVVTYDVDASRVRVERGGEAEFHDGSIFDFLAREQHPRHRRADLPFDFDCGFVGYLG